MGELRLDPELEDVKVKLESGIQVNNYMLEEGALLRIDGEGDVLKVVPKSDRKRLFQEAHSGLFAGDLCSRKIILLEDAGSRM
ncbi:unnamed protein product [Gongylonema pulchrum]|uniref:AbrB/MazE/SpoVT family DNA-binding domain-containing protein n=1 Tax=Gongylonema pulchrum TaxID=637853 RepID=A0A183DL84_9BILA|nr:unnamed protein product [Gongylonema pulchrum]